MACNWKLCLLITLISSQLALSFIILEKARCDPSDNELSPTKPKCSWIDKALKILPKYRNFFASLLQEGTSEFSYELQTIYSAICNVLSETDRRKQRKELLVVKWWIDNKKNLKEYLLEKGMGKLEAQ